MKKKDTEKQVETCDCCVRFTKTFFRSVNETLPEENEL